MVRTERQHACGEPLRSALGAFLRSLCARGVFAVVALREVAHGAYSGTLIVTGTSSPIFGRAMIQVPERLPDVVFLDGLAAKDRRELMTLSPGVL